MKKRIKLKGRIKTFINFGIYLGVLLLFVDVAMYLIDLQAGLLLTGYSIVYFIITLSLYFYNKPIIMNELISFATEYGQIQRKLLRDMDLPYALLDDAGKIIWTNTAFEAVVHQPKATRSPLQLCFPQSPGTGCRMTAVWMRRSMNWSTKEMSMSRSSRRYP